MNLADLLQFLGIPSHAVANTELKDLKLDSREVRPGDVFVACPGAKFDGREYVAAAVQNGAAVALVDSDDLHLALPMVRIPNLKAKLAELAAFFYGWPAEFLKIIGVTGTNGKTSVTHYIAQLLAAQQHACGIMGTLGNGWYGNLIPSNLTTSDNCSIHRQLAAFLRAGTKFVAMETSSHALDQRRLDFVKFSTAVFTNLTQDHLDYHQNMEDYFCAKAKLFAEFYPEQRIINLDDPYGERLLRTYGGISYSISNAHANIYSDGQQLYTPWGQGTFTNPLIGKFNLANLLAAVGVCGSHGADFKLMLDSIQQLQPVAGRMQTVRLQAADPLIVVDYAHTPDALANALRALQEHSHRKIYCIFGCGGDRDRSKRPLMVEAALAYSDQVVLTQDNPRTEKPEQIIADMLSLDNGTNIDKINVIMDRAEAIRSVISQAQTADIILIAGKGHEDYQIIGNEKREFSDVQSARAALAMRSEQAWLS